MDSLELPELERERVALLLRDPEEELPDRTEEDRELRLDELLTDSRARLLRRSYELLRVLRVAEERTELRPSSVTRETRDRVAPVLRVRELTLRVTPVVRTREVLCRVASLAGPP